MKKLKVIFIFLFLFLYGHAQKLQTIVPRQVVAGNAFQIQYIITDPANFVAITPPQFENLRLISGPNYYKGNSLLNGKMHGIENIAYTVMPLQPGIVKINSVKASFTDSKEEATGSIIITAIAQPKASFNTLSTYTDINLYAPSSKSNLDQLINENLFIKAEVDKTACFLGEAVTTTFKLYSRLQSTSEVINAPSLYGFSMMDILNINEAHQAVETINGKVFNTSVLRKLQLYPAQTGELVIDEIQVQNEIEFSDSITGKKIKIQKLLASKPVKIVVKPLPGKPPVNYSGAVGMFTMSTELPNPTLRANAQGRLIVTVRGKGNFIQFGAPVIAWPKEFDVFDPVITDEFDKNKVPTEGRRIYTYQFTTDRPDHFTIPAIGFSFFNPVTDSYKTIHTDSLRLEILPALANTKTTDGKTEKQSSARWWILCLVIGAALLVFVFFFLNRKRKEPPLSAPVTKTTYLEKFHQLTASALTGREICLAIQKLLTEINKEQQFAPGQKEVVQSIQNDCQLLIYSHMDLESKEIEELQKRTEQLLRQLQS
jgi:hypothetical protein